MKTNAVERGRPNARRPRTRRQLVAGGLLATAALADHDTYPLRCPSFIITPFPACTPRRPTASPALARAALRPPHVSPAAPFPLAATVCPIPSPRPLVPSHVPIGLFRANENCSFIFFFAPLQAIDPGCSSVASGAHTVSTWSVWAAGHSCSARPAAHGWVSSRLPLTAAFLVPTSVFPRL